MNQQRLDAELASLMDQRKSLEAINMVCDHASSRHLVWWGCQCAWSLWRPTPSASEDDALRVIVRWVVEQSDDARIACDTLSKAEPATATHSRWLLKAAVYSGGELPSSVEKVAAPTPDVSGRYVNGFLQNLLTLAGPIERHRSAHSFAQLAQQSLASPLPSRPEPTAALV